MVEKDYSLCGRTIGGGKGIFLVWKDYWWWRRTIVEMEKSGKFGVGVGVGVFFGGKMNIFEKRRTILPQCCRRRFFWEK